jgi:drug/metabolite transporter (DMT)-like permease
VISLGRLQLLAAAALFSTGGAAIKAANFDGWQIAGLRSGVAALVLLLLVPAARRGWHWRLLPVALAYACTLTLFVLANRLTTAANAIFLQSTAPLYLILLGPLVLREPLRRSDLLFIVVLGLGLTSFFVGSEAPVETAPDPLRGNVLALLSGVAWAFTVLGLRWLGRRPETGDSTLAAVTMGNLLVCFLALPVALPIGVATGVDWIVILYLGAVQVGLAYFLVTRGIRHVPALEASLLFLLEPALNPLWAWLVHDEIPSAWALFGGALILGATLARTLWFSRRGPASGPEPGVAVHG